MRTKHQFKRLLVGWLALALASLAWGYDLIRDGNGYIQPWGGHSVAIKNMLPTSPALSDGYSQSGSVQAAMQAWNANLNAVDIQFIPTIAAPGAYGIGNGVNEIVMDSTMDGEAFGQGVLAVTIGNGSQADIIFNSSYTWDSYRGVLRRDGAGRLIPDMHRVAIHELGHLLGLDHPDQASPRQSVTAIMNSQISNLDALAADDIAGGRALYGTAGVAPANDSFSNATAITAVATVTGTSVAASKEAMEPNHEGNVGGRSVWWKWTALATGSVTVTTQGSNYDTVLAVYTGASVAGLTLIASNDDVTPGIIRSSSLAFTATAGTTYYLAVDGWDGASGAIQLNLLLPPVVTAAPQGLRVNEGSTVNFSITAFGSGPLTYAWQVLQAGGWTSLTNTGGYSGTAGATLTITKVGMRLDGAAYRCVVTNPLGSATSAPAELTVTPTAPIITVTNPLRQVVTPGQSLHFSATATGVGTLTYQWYHNGRAIPGATLSHLTVDNVTPAARGYYLLWVSDTVGTRRSSASFAIVAPAVTHVTAWGSNYDNKATVPADLTNAVAIAAGVDSSLALKADGTVVGWGTNTYGLNNIPAGLTDVVAIALRTQGLALKADGTLVGWGANDAYGLNSTAATLTDVVAIAAGYYYSVAVKSDGTVVAWGDTTSSYRQAAVPVGLTDVVAIAVEEVVTLALKSDGTVVVWGHGQLGQQSSVPVGLTDVVDIAINDEHALALKADGTVVAWGDNSFGQLNVPAGLTGVSAIAAESIYSFALKPDGTMVYWGQLDYTPNLNSKHNIPDGLTGVMEIDFGFEHALALCAGPIVAPSFEMQPASQTVVAGSSVTFQARASGSAPLRYEWQRKPSGSTLWNAVGSYGSDTGATTPTLRVNMAYITMDGDQWRCVVTNVLGQTISEVATLTVVNGPGAPVITAQPQSATAQEDDWATFAMTVTGNEGMSYRWEIQGAGSVVWSTIDWWAAGGSSGPPSYLDYSGPALKVKASLFRDGSRFRCTVTNATGRVVSEAATLVVTIAPPKITAHPVGLAANVGSPVSLSVTATSSVAVTYQWQKEGVDIAGATGATWHIAGFQAGDVGDYRVVVSNSSGSVTSSVAKLAVAVAPVIVTQPAGQAVIKGAFATFTVAATSNAPPTYQWKKNGSDIPGATNSTLILPAVQAADEADYSVTVANIAGAVTSKAATLMVIQPPIIMIQPTAAVAVPTTNVSFTITATSTVAMSHQWQRRPAGGTTWADLVAGAGISGVTSDHLRLSNVQLANSGEAYRCIVSNAAGATTSNPVTLTVGVAGFARISAGRYHSLRLNLVSQLSVTGRNTQGQLGLGTTTDTAGAQPLALAGATIADVAAGAEHSLFLTSAGDVWGTGANAAGQLADGTTVAQAAPIRLATDAVGIAAGNFHSVILKKDGTLWTVGGNDSGQLGNGTTIDTGTLAQVASEVVDVAAGIRQTLFIKSDGTLWGMGDMNGSGVAVANPRPIATGVRAVAAGGYHSLFIKTDGSLWAMGYNAYGQLGNGTTTDSNTPVPIATGVRSVAAGYFHSAFIKTDEFLWVMGYNSGGQLGDGTHTSRSIPQLMTLEGVAVVSASESYTLYVSYGGTLNGSGYNAYGQFGNGSLATSTRPIEIAGGTFLTPSTPVGLTATVVTSRDRVHLSWAPVADAVSYEIWRTRLLDGGGGVRIAAGLRWPIYEDRAVDGGTDYHYWVRAINPRGVSPFSVAVAGSADGLDLHAPVIITPPLDLTVNVGDAVNFSVGANGTAPLSYQWRKNGGEITGATNHLYTINPVSAGDAGSFDVIVTNSLGSATSAAATLTVNQRGQTITFATLANRPFGLAPINLSATASSGLSVTFAVTAGPASVSENRLMLTGTGTVTVRASQAGDATYDAATPVERSFTVTANFDSWALANFTALERADVNVSGPNAIYGQDGLPNLVKYALGLDPKVNATSGLPVVTTTATDWVYTYTKPVEVTDVSYAVEVSTALSSWTTAGVALSLVSTSGGVETWEARYPLSSANNAFFRLRVTQ